MFQITVAEAGSKFDHLIEAARRGEEVLITENNHAIARLLPATATDIVPNRRPGSAKGKILYVADDFDAPLDDFTDYQ